MSDWLSQWQEIWRPERGCACEGPGPNGSEDLCYVCRKRTPQESQLAMDLEILRRNQVAVEEENQRLRERVGELQNSLADFKLYLKTTEARNRASKDGSDVCGLVLGVFDKKFPEIECKKSMRHEDRDGGLSYMEAPNA